MTKEGWRCAVIEAVQNADEGNDELLKLLVHLLTEQDQAKQALRDLGYGCTGMPWADVVEEIRDGARRADSEG
jgi:hypothetical protein